MTDKRAYIPDREMAEGFDEGDPVKFPIRTRGNTYAPTHGRVVTVLDGIGQLDVATATGTIRLPAHDVVKDDSLEEEVQHLVDTGCETWDKAKNRDMPDDEYSYASPRVDSHTYVDRPGRIASSYTQSLTPIVKDAVDGISDHSSPMSLYDDLFQKYSSHHSDEEIKSAMRLAFRHLRG